VSLVALAVVVGGDDDQGDKRGGSEEEHGDRHASDFARVTGFGADAVAELASYSAGNFDVV
jgi:hypothetical protein